MTATSQQPDAEPAPPAAPPKKHRNAWIWVSGVLGLIAVGLLIWALTLRSDVGSTQTELDGAKQQLTSANKDLETTSQQLDDATKAAAAPTPTPTPAPAEEE